MTKKPNAGFPLRGAGADAKSIMDLRIRMTCSGHTQRCLATYVGVSISFFNRMLKGHRFMSVAGVGICNKALDTFDEWVAGGWDVEGQLLDGKRYFRGGRKAGS